MAKHNRNGVWLIISAFLFVILIPSISGEMDKSHHGEGNHSHHPDKSDGVVDFFDLQGTKFTDTMVLNGTINRLQNNYSWEIIDLFNFDSEGNNSKILSGEYFDVITPISPGIWTWSIELNISEYDCTCNFITTSEVFNSQGNIEIFNSSLIIYLGSIDHRPFIEMDTIINSKTSSNEYSISADFISPITLESSELILESELCQIISNNCIENSIFLSLNFSLIENVLMIFINTSSLNLEDGNWLLSFTVKDSFLRQSNKFSSRMTFDDSPPIVVLSSVDNILESQPFLVYATVDDGYVGSKISLTWTITEPNGFSRGLMDNEYYHNSTIELSLNKSGNWSIQILVRDSADFIVKKNITVNVENIPPSIEIQLDGLSVNQNDEIRLVEGSSWIIDASNSFDTQNDIENIVFEWFIDGEKISSNSSTLTSDEINTSGEHEIKLIIYDDDMQSSNISFYISNTETQIDDFPMIGFIFIIGLLIVILIPLTLKIFSKNNSNHFELPKWGNKNKP